MITLKEQEAVDYLKRVRSCIHPEDCLNQLQLLATMLDIEAVYIEDLASSDLSDMAKITITSSGFPELKSWHVDINQAFRKLDEIKAKRAKALSPLIFCAKSINRAGIIEQSKQIAAGLAKDCALRRVLFGLSDDQRRMFSTGEVGNFIFTESQFPGMLLGKEWATPFQNTKYPNWHQIRNVSNRVGFKYLDFKTSNTETQEIIQGPMLFYTELVPSEYENIKIMTPVHSLLSIRKSVPGKCDACDKPHFDISSYCELWGASAKERIFIDLERSYNFLTFPFKKVLMNADLTGVGDFGRYAFQDALFRSAKAVSRIIRVYSDAIDGIPIPEDSFLEENVLFIETVENILVSLPGDDLRKTLQIGCAESLNEVGNLAKGLITTDLSKTIEMPAATKQLADRKKRFFLF